MSGGLAKAGVLALWGGVLVAADHVTSSFWCRIAVAVATAVPMAWALDRIGGRRP
ncbi:hypothetical protein ACIPYS_39525 [Kitasatospora sp. NPDC089913]|uniref:hypothetical protein n=1 Tax=Kitasatospora sp. NPDC089913 TaxID=3364080 RepID=UPI00382A39F2